MVGVWSAKWKEMMSFLGACCFCEENLSVELHGKDCISLSAFAWALVVIGMVAFWEADIGYPSGLGLVPARPSADLKFGFPFYVDLSTSTPFGATLMISYQDLA